MALENVWHQRVLWGVVQDITTRKAGGANQVLGILTISYPGILYQREGKRKCLAKNLPVAIGSAIFWRHQDGLLAGRRSKSSLEG